MIGDGILLFLALWPMAGALVCYLIGRRNKELRSLAADGVTIVEFGVLVFLLLQVIGGRTYDFVWKDFCGLGLVLKLDGFRALYGLIAAWMWMMTTIFSKEYFAHYRNRNRYYLFLLVTLGATVGVFLSADLYTTFIFFEIMSFTSYVWVAQNETPQALRAADTYLAVAVIGGMTLLVGLLWLGHLLGSLEFAWLPELAAQVTAEDRWQLYGAGGCCLVGFGAKAGMFPLHIWLPKAHPVAPAPASALLSGILTKSGVFGVLIVSRFLFWADVPWNRVILALGTVTMALGAVLALFSIDLKRTLACSSMSQIGFILVGVAIDFMGQVESLLISRQYEGLMGKTRIRGRA